MKEESKQLDKVNSGIKYDDKKPKLELLPPSYWKSVGSIYSLSMANWYFYKQSFPESLGFDAVPILEYGASSKYGAHNWFKGMRWGKLVAAFHRHVNCFDETKGLWIPRDLTALDSESKLPHGQHAECNRIMLYEYYTNGIGENDCAWYVNNPGNNNVLHSAIERVKNMTDLEKDDFLHRAGILDDSGHLADRYKSDKYGK